MRHFVRSTLLACVAIPTRIAFDGDDGPKFEMPSTVDSLDIVPDAFKGFYEEKNGKFALADVSGLKNALKTTRTEREDAKKRAKSIEKWEGLGKTPEEIQELLDKENEKDEKKKKDEGDFESLKKQLTDKHAGDLKKKEDQILALTKQVENLMIGSVAKSEIAKHGGSEELLLPIIERQTRCEKNDEGNFVVRVIDAEGKHRLANSKGDFMTIGHLVEEMKESTVFGRAFDADAGSGMGTEGNGGGKPGGSGPKGKVTAPKTWAECKTKEERAAFLVAKQARGKKDSSRQTAN